MTIALPLVFLNDPPARPDGMCIVCRKPRHPERSRKYARELAERDPFCLNLCARIWHANPISDRSIWGEPRGPE